MLVFVGIVLRVLSDNVCVFVIEMNFFKTKTNIIKTLMHTNLISQPK